MNQDYLTVALNRWAILTLLLVAIIYCLVQCIAIRNEAVNSQEDYFSFELLEMHADTYNSGTSLINISLIK